MKLPLSILKLAAAKGVLSRLNPLPLVGKIGGKLKFGKKKKAKDGDRGEDDFLPSGADDGDDMFADLGDLDALDAQAKERERDANAERQGDGAAEPDYSPTETPEDLNDMSSGEDGDDAPGGAPDEFPDLEGVPEDVPRRGGDAGDGGPDGGEAGDVDLSDLEEMPDFEDDEDLADEEDRRSKKRKLLMVAGGGIALAIMIGAASWLLLSPEAPQQQAGGARGVTISLDDVPMAGDEGAARPAPTSASGGTSRAAAPTEGDGAADVRPSEIGVLSSPNRNLSPVDRTLAQLGLNAMPEPGVGIVVPNTTQASYAALGAAPAGEPLRTAPVDGLVQQADVGMLPKIGEDGLTPFDAYARPEPQGLDPARPKVALIVTGLGLSRASTEAAIRTLPQSVTLALSNYARGMDFWMTNMRDDGHEVLLQMPSDSERFPFNDPGPDALQSLDAPEDNLRKLQFILSRTTGYFGVLAVNGSKFLASEDQVKPVMNELKGRGLMYVDGGADASVGPQVAFETDLQWAQVELNLDDATNAQEFQRLLDELEALARKRARTVARVSPTPMALAHLQAWIAGLNEKGIDLVPVSALAKKQLIR